MITIKAEVIVSPNIIPEPDDHEIAAAWILARHFNCKITFIKPLGGYKIKTPDIVMNNLEWEIKSPRGNKKRTIRNNLDLAKEQSPNIIIDTRRTNLADNWIEAELNKQLHIKKGIFKIIMISKDETVIEIPKKRK